MKINSITTPISFQKTFITNATILKNGENHECQIYELDSVEDKDYFEKLRQDKKWRKANLINAIEKYFLRDYATEKTYTMEDENGCLGVIDIDIFNDERIDINWLETCPKYAHKNKLRGTKNIGRALINFVVNLAKENNIEKIAVPDTTKKSFDFYDKYGFYFSTCHGEDVMIMSEDFDYVLEKNNYKK